MLMGHYLFAVRRISKCDLALPQYLASTAIVFDSAFVAVRKRYMILRFSRYLYLELSLPIKIQNQANIVTDVVFEIAVF